MQAFRLVNGGYVDRVIIFDSLPERLLSGIKTRALSGLPRSWSRWLSSIGSVRDVMKTETTQHLDRSYTFKYTPIGKEPCFFVLEYTDINSDKESWRAICEHLRLTVGPETRLKEKVEDMAIPMAPDSKAPLTLEPEDIPVIPVPEERIREISKDELVKPEEQIVVDEKPQKKRGRPKKIMVGA